jgi:hypothetical protein
MENRTRWVPESVCICLAVIVCAGCQFFVTPDDKVLTDYTRFPQVKVTPMPSGGYAHSLSLLTDGRLYAWGENSDGQLGDGTTENRHIPTLLPERFAYIAAGARQTLGLKRSGRLYAWGWNEYGQLGDGTTVNRHTPTLIGSGYAQVSAGGDHTLALTSDGRLYAWGANYIGQLGDGTTENRHTPTLIEFGG